MAKKDIEIYYEQVCSQYNEMIQNLNDMEQYAKENIIEPERIDKLKAMIEPIKNNYMTLSYIMFLLNAPNKNNKLNRYIKQNKKYLSSIDSRYHKQAILDRSQKIIDAISLNMEDK